MLIALATYEDRLAALFENACELRLFIRENDKIYPAGRHSLPYSDPCARISALTSCGVTLLICGGLTGCSRRLLIRSGIEIIPWIGGEVETVLHAWATDRLGALVLPGCHNSGRCCGSRTLQSGSGCRQQHRGHNTSNKQGVS